MVLLRKIELTCGLAHATFDQLQAFWIDRNTIAIQQAYLVSGGVYKLFSDPTAQLKLTATGVTGGTSLTLTPSGALSAEQIARFPQLYSRIGFVHQFRPLSGLELQGVIEHQWVQLGLDSGPSDY